MKGKAGPRPKAAPTHISDLTPDPNNFRKRTERSHAAIVDSLQEVGAARSIVIDEHDVILAGNGVVEAAAEAGIEKVRVIDASGDEIIAVRRRNLTPDMKQRLALFDNRAAELSEWDTEKLAAAFAAQPTLSGKMWTVREAAAVVSGVARALAAPAEPVETVPAQAAPTPAPATVPCPHCHGSGMIPAE